MSELKRYWVVVHYERELEAESDWDAAHDIRIGNTIVENATVIVKELPEQGDLCKALIHNARREARQEEALSIVLRQISHRTKDYSFVLDGVSSLPSEIQTKLQQLSLEQLEMLSVDALEMSSLDDLNSYLDNLPLL
jgi:hypothetical protein